MPHFSDAVALPAARHCREPPAPHRSPAVSGRLCQQPSCVRRPSHSALGPREQFAHSNGNIPSEEPGVLPMASKHLAREILLGAPVGGSCAWVSACCFGCDVTCHEDFVRPNCSWCARRHAIRQCADKSAHPPPVFAAARHEPGAGGATARPSKPTSES